MAGNFSHVIKSYLASDVFEGLAPSTKYNYSRALRDAEVGLGFLPADVINPKLVQEYLDGWGKLPGKQSVAKGALLALQKWAVVRGHLLHPIMTGTQTIGSDDGHEPWTDEQVAAAIQHARPDLARAIMLAVHTGQRGSDIVKMRWSDIEEKDGYQGINVIQQKTGKQLWVPFTGALAAELRGWTKAPPFFLILTPGGTQFSRNRLSHDWTLERDANPELAQHKERGLVIHGLRATAVVRLRKLGCTELEISSMVGMSLPMVTRYCRLFAQNKLAMAAVMRLENFKVLQTNPLKTKDAPL